MCFAMLTADDATTQLATTADRLRAVRQAEERFLALWAVDHILDDVAGRLADDASDGLADDATPDNHGDPAALTRPLFRNGRLDD